MDPNEETRGANLDSDLCKKMAWNIGNKIIALKDDRLLFAQFFVIISRSWPEINIKEVIGTCECSAIPRAIFPAG